jgi:hypothetical protein
MLHANASQGLAYDKTHPYPSSAPQMQTYSNMQQNQQMQPVGASQPKDLLNRSEKQPPPVQQQQHNYQTPVMQHHGNYQSQYPEYQSQQQQQVFSYQQQQQQQQPYHSGANGYSQTQPQQPQYWHQV